VKLENPAGALCGLVIDGRLESRPEFETGINNSSRNFLHLSSLFVLKWSMRPRVRAF